MKRRGKKRSTRFGEAAWTAAGERDHLGRDLEDDVLGDVTIEELREFLEADLVDVPVDRAFKESLRERLWDLVRRRDPRSRH